jgi:hypothetical protein
MGTPIYQGVVPSVSLSPVTGAGLACCSFLPLRWGPRGEEVGAFDVLAGWVLCPHSVTTVLFLCASAVFVAGQLDLFMHITVDECFTLITLSWECLWGVLSGVGRSMMGMFDLCQLFNMGQLS